LKLSEQGLQKTSWNFCVILFVASLTFRPSFINGQSVGFKFAFLSDTHVGSTTGLADLRRTVNDLNLQKGIQFVLITGDITESGTNEQMDAVKRVLDSLTIPLHILPGNHDTGWSESGATYFRKLWGEEKLLFDFGGYRFVGCSSGPYLRMAFGHTPREQLRWLDTVALQVREKPVIFVDHYPLDSSLDNWYEVLARIKKMNIKGVLFGHGHANKAYTFEGIPATMGRSNLRAADSVGGYNVVSVRNDSLFFNERTPGVGTKPAWRIMKLGAAKPIDMDGAHKPAVPDYSINAKYPYVHPSWVYHSRFNSATRPLVLGRLVFIGNSGGGLEAVNLKTGKRAWNYSTRGPIYSSPQAGRNTLIFGSADGYVYCLSPISGKLLWKFKTGAAVLGSPLIRDGIVYIGSSDHKFRAINSQTGMLKWTSEIIKGYIPGQPALAGGLIIFGAWDTYLYALEVETGKCRWKWTSGSKGILLSPAMCTPVIHDGKVFIAAPDQYLTALNLMDGKIIWRTKQHKVRESIGLSDTQNELYAKTMQDSIIAVSATGGSFKTLWTSNLNYGYEISPSELVTSQGTIYIPTTTGTIYAVNKNSHQINYAFKLDNTMINTVTPVDKNHVLASSIDGKLALIEENAHK